MKPSKTVRTISSHLLPPQSKGLTKQQGIGRGRYQAHSSQRQTSPRSSRQQAEANETIATQAIFDVDETGFTWEKAKDLKIQVYEDEVLQLEKKVNELIGDLDDLDGSYSTPSPIVISIRDRASL